ncbi:MAG: hypothetical protein JXA89_06890 [Anaerolineae bacterium]|nr:hypothetical protein [Anaerolineae bacterium]
MLVKVPRVFMMRIIRSCVESAKTGGITEITSEFLARIQDKQSAEKGNSDLFVVGVLSKSCLC